MTTKLDSQIQANHQNVRLNAHHSVRLSAKLQCANPDCLHPENAVGRRLCDRCQSLLEYRYLWAVGGAAARIPVGSLVENRYLVMGSQVWLDTQPAFKPSIPNEVPDRILPYLTLYLHRLHVPEFYGFAAPGQGLPPLVLLENVPIDEKGERFPGIESAWMGASPTRQLNWLWQLLQLWLPLREVRQEQSLLLPQNLRVEGWRVRLQELIPTPSAQPVQLRDLAATWLTWIDQSHPRLVAPLKALCQQMQAIESDGLDLSQSQFTEIAQQLNQLLVSQAATLPLKLKVAGGTTTGTQRAHNEDACFPNQAQVDDVLTPYVGMICDGVGGHEGGEVASHLAVDSLKLQLKYFLTEVAEESDFITPGMVERQLTSIVRVANNIIASRNDTQGREFRRRMGTTLVMALQLPQRIRSNPGLAEALASDLERDLEHKSELELEQKPESKLDSRSESKPGYSHELYITHVGDSRAYWITPHYCHRLTVDDDVATREVSRGRMALSEAAARPDGGALTQALGTRTGNSLYPTVQRFVVEENGVLLLCSDGLSDNHRVEQIWGRFTELVLQGDLTLEEAVEFWLEVADHTNGHDNTSVVLMHCQVDQTSTAFQFKVDAPPQPEAEPELEYEDLAVSSIALLYDESNRYDPEFDFLQPPTVVTPTTKPRYQQRKSNPLLISMGLTVVILVCSVIGLGVWHRLNPQGFWQAFDRVFGTQASQGEGERL